MSATVPAGGATGRLGASPWPTARHCWPQASHCTVRPVVQTWAASIKYRVAHLGQVSIMSGIGHRNSEDTESPFFTSPIFRSMSRTAAEASIATQPSPPGDAAVLRVQRAAPRAGRGAAEARCAVTFALDPGDAHVLAGDPGSGKTAILEMIGLARPPARGGIELFGRDLATVRPRDRHGLRRRIGFIFQHPRLIADLSAWDNVALAAATADREAADYAAQIDEVLAWVGLGRRGAMMAGGLDEEGRRRLGVARAVINRPDLLIADDPAADGGLAILKLLADLNEAGATLLMAMGDVDLAAQTGADITYLTAASQARAGDEARGEPAWSR